MSDEKEHCETAARDTLDKWAIKFHPDGVYNHVAWRDIADLIECERKEAVRGALDKAVRACDIGAADPWESDWGRGQRSGIDICARAIRAMVPK